MLHPHECGAFSCRQDGNAIDYDAIGNPTTWYDGTAFTWVNGRRLASASNTGLTASYTYDSDGLRLTKTINGVEHKYLWQGSKLVSEYYDGKELEFFYDESGNPYAFSYKAGSTATPITYYYLTNLQGDITGILDSSGTTVATYTYNAWGKLLSSTGDLASINPLRYRGYYYDAELEMYYLKSRYYDPEICRFINADDASLIGADGSFLSHNLFSYCKNNPLSLADYDGNLANWVIGGLVGGLIGGITSAMQGDSFWAGAAQGAVAGAIAGFGVDVALLAFSTGGVGFAVLAAFSGGYLGSLAGDQAYSIVKTGKFREPDGSDYKRAFLNGAINVLSFGVSGLYKAATGGFDKAPVEQLKESIKNTFKVTLDDVYSTFTAVHFTIQGTITNLLIK